MSLVFFYSRIKYSHKILQNAHYGLLICHMLYLFCCLPLLTRREVPQTQEFSCFLHQCFSAPRCVLGTKQILKKYLKTNRALKTMKFRLNNVWIALEQEEKEESESQILWPLSCWMPVPLQTPQVWEQVTRMLILKLWRSPVLLEMDTFSFYAFLWLALLTVKWVSIVYSWNICSMNKYPVTIILTFQSHLWGPMLKLDFYPDEVVFIQPEV